MKHILHTVLILAITVQVNGTLFSVVLFSLNRHEIAARLCERRTPDCCGKCYLEKTIAKQDGSADRTTAKIMLAEPNIEATVPSFLSLQEPGSREVHFTSADYRLLPGFLSSVKQPPKFV